MAALETASYNAILPAVSNTKTQEGKERAKNYACALGNGDFGGGGGDDDDDDDGGGGGGLHYIATAQEMTMAQICVEPTHVSNSNYCPHSTNSL